MYTFTVGKVGASKFCRYCSSNLGSQSALPNVTSYVTSRTLHYSSLESSLTFCRCSQEPKFYGPCAMDVLHGFMTNEGKDVMKCMKPCIGKAMKDVSVLIGVTLLLKE